MAKIAVNQKFYAPMLTKVFDMEENNKFENLSEAEID
jgi:hypothetical protein